MGSFPLKDPRLGRNARRGGKLKSTKGPADTGKGSGVWKFKEEKRGGKEKKNSFKG